ncbi:MAG: hypothetical protein A2268_08300 [Candidatus Raymondbacteria bacterium RifOxyA12_full_50_37]|uniref:Uncharacterized protein n=1 Tax=Candidatus Raymondbacteria bacterium RIFOXYD12_FULL_49_13 TaxID=1817890 RepID=A0A1F7F3V5_UNCRA|nr:MAG: hypothetical protein A2268_08300 [Candidatus Raymondbacteria bacterium RifOxyA12_full_50_37]OGJ90334.1 MAG: hypothetical protein A2248_17235 [Candidatus Raymondbacteria bacterium RIFOXYA2_FULL_49_16]OGJ99510.1 MAG: hypothetical protein A2350_00705 [Candidatus Raymondbacteria bacterium RifOxyB12_full_50_8]OGK01329.1 MAG: hypothetical protein A2519_13085 [Candidatus Raymondbacteria bacterium RIFOXYD12_FULL_49_13]OGK07515.1 MAG: hypothetical protein A2487_11370 [Candidatus Raymondbacteria 
MKKTIMFPLLLICLIGLVFSQTESPVQKQIKQQGALIKNMQKRMYLVQKDLEVNYQQLSDSLNLRSETLKRLFDSLNTQQDTLESFIKQNNMLATIIVESLTEKTLTKLSQLERRAATYFFAAVIIVLGIFGFIIFKFMNITRKLDATAFVMKETITMDTKICEIMQNQQRLMDEKRKEKTRLKGHEAVNEPETNPGLEQTRIIPSEKDHSLFIRLGEEIFRMRLRIKRIPEDIKGKTALDNALKRLEDELNMQGYAMSDLTDQPYFDEMTVVVKDFVPVDDMPAGQQKVLRMLKPQIKYKDTVISQGEVEVAMSSEDMAQK